MTVQAIATPESYVGNGVTTLFPVNFNFFLPNDLLVTLVDTTSGSPVTSTLVLNGTPGYSVAGGLSAVTGLSGNGSITTSWAPTAYQTIIISPNFALTQQTHYVPNSPFPAASHENALDRLTLIAQQQAVALGECVQAPVGVLGFNGTLPFITPSVYSFGIGLNTNGTGLAWIANGNAQQLTQLGDTTNPANGSGMIGYNPALAYAAGTVGYTLKNALTITAVGAYIVGQTGNSFTTTGTGAAYIGTPASPATNAAGQRVNATFALAGTVAAPTIAISGQAAMPLVQLNTAGALVACVPTLNLNSDLISNGTQWVILNPAPAVPIGVKSNFSNLHASVGATSTSVVLSADELIAEDASGNLFKATNYSAPCNLANSGANGLDTGSLATATWYYIYAIYNPTAQTWASLASLSGGSPTMPSGYTAKAMISAVRSQASSPYYLWTMIQYGNEVQWVVAGIGNLTSMASLLAGNNGSWAYGALTGWAPNVGGSNQGSASKVRVAVQTSASGGGNAGAASNGNFAGSSLGDPMWINFSGGANMAGGSQGYFLFDPGTPGLVWIGYLYVLGYVMNL